MPIKFQNLWPRLSSCYRPAAPLALANEYQLARFLILRLLGLCYTVVFLVVIFQGPGLIGEHGILPAGRFLTLVAENQGGAGNAFWKLPSIFWLNHSDAFLLAVGWTGLALSLAVLAGYANSLILVVLWALQLSLVHIGQQFWGYGWETQLLETTFLAIFLVPLLDGRPFPKTRPSRIVIWLYRWLIARIMIGAGLIKLRGDESWDWSQLSALFFHFETQPIPNGLSWYFHHLPKPALQAGVAINHIVELFVPILILAPPRIRNWAGAVMIVFQINLILSGNLSFLNFLTIIPCLACIDDRFYRRLLPSSCWTRIRETPPPPGPLLAWKSWPFRVRAALLAVVCLLSIAPTANLFSPNQRMNSSFDPLHLVNTYGAFGSVGQTRFELAVEGTDNPDPNSPWAEWREYGFHGKPGDPARRPPCFAPYQHRLDWEIWFVSSFGQTKSEPLWPVYLAARLLEARPETLALFRENPFPGRPPRAIRIVRYQYRFTTPAERAASTAWWIRQPAGVYLAPITRDDPRLQQLLRRTRWPNR